VMSEESRLGRESIEVSYALKQLVQAGVRVFLYLEDRERTLDSPIEKVMLSLATFADELEREKARQRTYDALRRRAEHGYVTGGTVFGYDNVREPAGVRRRISAPQAAVVQRIFELAASGSGLTSIAKQLNAAAAPAPRAQQGRPTGWAPSSVREVLYRPLYRGEILWNQSRKRDAWGVTHQRPRPEAEWLRVPAPDLAIVSASQWEAAHRQMAVQRARFDHTGGPGGPAWGRPTPNTCSPRCCDARGAAGASSRAAGGQAGAGWRSTAAPPTTGAGARCAAIRSRFPRRTRTQPCSRRSKPICCIPARWCAAWSARSRV